MNRFTVFRPGWSGVLPEALADEATVHHEIVLDVVVRPCRPEDVAELEWFGLYRHHREIFAQAFARHMRGENIMLVADLDGFPAGQAWVDLVKRAGEGIGYIWAVRVFPFLRGHGIGSLLMRAAEDLLRERGFVAAEVGVEKDNDAARRLYLRLGYRHCMDLREEYSYTTPDAVYAHHVVDQWVLRKPLAGPP
jgi:ribosomal protein S18 acetylase RimI-like enzyme